MNRKKGFTLIELLIAGTIVGILAVFATVAYRNSVADARVEAAKASTNALAAAVQRYRLDPGSCPEVNESNVKGVINGLEACNLLQNNYNYYNNDSYFKYDVCEVSDSSLCSTEETEENEYYACVTGKEDSKLPEHYRSGYLYCMTLRGPVEESSSLTPSL